MRKKFLIAVLFIVGLFFNATTAQAEVKTYEGVGEYWITKGETVNAAKQQAKKFAERDALEQIYLYVKSQSSAKNSRLTKDEIISIVAGLISSIAKTKYFTDMKDGILVVTAVVIAEIDSEKIPEAVERHKDKKLNEGS